jgi:hypothetical protein
MVEKKKNPSLSARKSVVTPRTGVTMPRGNSAGGMRISKPRISKGVATTPGFKPTKTMKTKIY